MPMVIWYLPSIWSPSWITILYSKIAHVDSLTESRLACILDHGDSSYCIKLIRCYITPIPISELNWSYTRVPLWLYPIPDQTDSLIWIIMILCEINMIHLSTSYWSCVCQYIYCIYLYILGVERDCHLQWNLHIATVSSKLVKSIGIISKVRYKLNRFLLIQLHYSTFHQFLRYANIIWGSAAKMYLDELFKLQEILETYILQIIYLIPKISSLMLRFWIYISIEWESNLSFYV